MSAVSLRPLLEEKVRPLLAKFGTSRVGTGDLLVELVVGLSSYREEGLAYAPLVFVCENLDGMLAMVRGSDPIVVGREVDLRTAARIALRTCAPLGEGRRWAMYLRLLESAAEYGVFRPEGSLLRPTSFELLRRTAEADPAVVGLTQLRSGVVEIRSSAGTGHYFDFSGSPEEARNPGYVVQELVEAVTSSAPEDVRSQLKAFYYRIGVDILTGDHGALAVILADGVPPPAVLADGIWLQKPVDLTDWIRRDNAGSTREGAQALLAFAQLIRRMTMMDGITVFGKNGTVLAYGCFFRAPELALPSAYSVGGARRRAFDLLRRHLGKEIAALLYRSQDGAAEFVASPP